MSGYSLDDLLELMKERTVTEGWGAVAIFNRRRVNHLLEQQFIERYTHLGFIPPLNGRVRIDENDTVWATPENITLGPPLVSFATASLQNSRAVVSMNMVGGRYVTSRHAPGEQPVVMSIVNIREAHGFKLEMDIDLSLVEGEVSQQGKVTLDLSKAVNFSCNLARDDDEVNARLASYFKESFEALPPHRSNFLVGMLDLKGYNKLNPVSFRIATQAAPGAKKKGALNYGDGAVVMCVQLAGNTGPGLYPPPADWPYLIPNNRSPDGTERYSASLIVAENMLQHADGGNLEVLDSMQFPGANIFKEVERHVPRDLGVFGNVSPKNTAITLEPAFKTINAGDTQRFTLKNWKGDEIQASSWRAISLQSHTEQGHGSIAAGLYTAISPALMGHELLDVVVTAEYVEEGVSYAASALLKVVFDSMTISPQVATCSTAAQTRAMALAVSTLDDAPVTWKLVAPVYGTLIPSGDQAQFTANAGARTKGLVVQQIEATGTQTRQSLLVLLNAQQMRVQPAYVPHVQNAAKIQLQDDPTLLPDLTRRWKVVGDGIVDAVGNYTASNQGTTGSNVVQCEIVRNGVIFQRGHSVIERTQWEPEPSWQTLSQFAIRVPGGGDNGRLGSLFRNGYQQLRAQITVQTQPVDGKEYPLSVTEKASMRLMDDATKDKVEGVDDGYDGIPDDDTQVWRTNGVPNRFNLAGSRSSAATNTGSDSPRAPISIIDMYIHSRAQAGATATFYAEFQQDGTNRWWDSTTLPTLNSKIDVTPLALPMLGDDAYSVKRVRVEGGSEPPGGDENDQFDFHLRTTDYWIFAYIGRPGTPGGAAFETVEFLPVEGNETNISSIRWESEQLAERMCSYTSWYFEDRLKPADNKLKFDEDLKSIVKNENLDIEVNRSAFERGTLVVSLHRSDKVDYVRPNVPVRMKLSRDLAVKLIDTYGNPHFMRIAFLPANVYGNRNRLVRTLFTPAP